VSVWARQNTALFNRLNVCLRDCQRAHRYPGARHLPVKQRHEGSLARRSAPGRSGAPHALERSRAADSKDRLSRHNLSTCRGEA
jgi:hypothetical protein